MRSTGTFIHYVLEHAGCSKVRGRRPADQPTVRKACREAVRSVAEELGGEANRAFQYLVRRLVRAVEQILDNVIEQLRVSDFAPIDYELDFSRSGDLPPVQCEDGDVSVSLSGKVDRVDGYIKNGRLYLRVMDYKSGKKSFSLSDIWYGLNMQLIIYLYAAAGRLGRYRAPDYRLNKSYRRACCTFRCAMSCRTRRATRTRKGCASCAIRRCGVRVC
ncbi:MAG: PD-(D/E)XK nuclease family protein [Butyricicoccus sp.]